MSHSHPRIADARRALVCAVLLALLPGVALAQEASQSQDAKTVVGRVVTAHGAAFAQSPGEDRRILECRDPIYDGDTVFTLEDSAVGIDSGSYYVRLGENTNTVMTDLESGAPRVDLQDGHVRVIDSAAPGAAPSAEVATPGLVLAKTGGDQDALVFTEKAGVVSMVCAYGQDLDVARRSDPNETLTAPSEGCVVGKPREPLFAADASHPQLAVLMRDACEEVALVPASSLLTPASVGLGPAALAGVGLGTPPAPPPVAPTSQPCTACTNPSPTNFPFVPPVLPPLP